jgi:hypothetical protein
MQCPVCGGPLTDTVSHCSRCPMNRGCEMICCENCGYETVAPRSATLDFFKRLFRRKGSRHGASRIS